MKQKQNEQNIWLAEARMILKNQNSNLSPKVSKTNGSKTSTTPNFYAYLAINDDDDKQLLEIGKCLGNLGCLEIKVEDMEFDSTAYFEIQFQTREQFIAFKLKFENVLDHSSLVDDYVTETKKELARRLVNLIKDFTNNHSEEHCASILNMYRDDLIKAITSIQ